MKFLLAIILFISAQLFSEDLTIICENNYFFKLEKINSKNEVLYYKEKDKKWLKIKYYLLKDEALELTLPENDYMACHDKKFQACKYKVVISDIFKKRSSYNEVVLDDCYIGTMGCNKYKKNLSLHQSYCKKYNQ